MYSIDEIVALAKKIHGLNYAKWWEGKNRCPIEALQLANTEICEGTQGDRKNAPDDHLPHRKMAEVEMADFFIRLLDWAEGFGYDLKEVKVPSTWPNTWSIKNSLAARHFGLVDELVKLGRLHDMGMVSLVVTQIGYAISGIFQICQEEAYDLRGAVNEKLEYNKTRPDHQVNDNTKAY